MSAENSKDFGIFERAAAETAALRHLQNDLGNTPSNGGPRRFHWQRIWIFFTVVSSPSRTGESAGCIAFGVRPARRSVTGLI
jgi:hypothetical protein